MEKPDLYTREIVVSGVTLKALETGTPEFKEAFITMCNLAAQHIEAIQKEAEERKRFDPNIMNLYITI